VSKTNVGYIAAVFFAANSLCSWAWGQLIPRTGRRSLFVITLLTHIAFYGVLLAVLCGQQPSTLSEADNGPAASVFVAAMAVVFALGDSVLESQIPAIIQSPTFFPEERDRNAANANVRLFQSLGYTAQFGAGIALPGNVLVQTCIVPPMMLAALACLFALDRWVQPLDTPATGSVKGAYAAINHGGEGEEGAGSGLKGDE
jgi:MFS family permease